MNEDKLTKILILISSELSEYGEEFMVNLGLDHGQLTSIHKQRRLTYSLRDILWEYYVAVGKLKFEKMIQYKLKKDFLLIKYSLSKFLSKHFSNRNCMINIHIIECSLSADEIIEVIARNIHDINFYLDLCGVEICDKYLSGLNLPEQLHYYYNIDYLNVWRKGKMEQNESYENLKNNLLQASKDVGKENLSMKIEEIWEKIEKGTRTKIVTNLKL